MAMKLTITGWRRLSQTIVGLLLTNSYVQVIVTKIPYDGALRGVCIPYLNCHSCPMAVFSCPIGMLQYFMALHRFPFFLLGFFIVVGLTVGRAACGWLCPFGLIQDLMFKIKTKKFAIPKFLNYGKYVALVVLVLILPYFTYQHWFSKLCPYGALIAAIPWVAWNPINPDFESPTIGSDAVGTMYVIKLAILAFFLVWFVVSRRPFCRTTCPLGAIWALFNRVSLLRANISNDCSDCQRCSKICPMDLNVCNDLDSENCIKCLDCTTCNHIRTTFKIE